MSNGDTVARSTNLVIKEVTSPTNNIKSNLDIEESVNKEEIQENVIHFII